jgi:hypothetical protein
MGLRSRSACCAFCAVLAGLLLGAATVGSAQTTKPAPSYPAHLPYSFGNFVWWSDEELRALLKKRIPGLGDEIAPTTATEGRIRDALKAMLKEKGILAEIQSEEPSFSSFSGSRDPEAPGPSIEFSFLKPQIRVDKILLPTGPEDVLAALQTEAREDEGKLYSSFGDWYRRSRVKTILRQNGYLSAQVQVDRQPPRKDGDRYFVSLLISVDAGPKYHISSINADGGPLLAGKDLSRFYGMKVGDVPGRYPLSSLAGQIRDLYLRYGCADVEVENQPVLDRDHALVAYHLNVVPGPIYHLRSLTAQHLNAAQESRVRELLGMKPGDVYSDAPITGLYHKIADDPVANSLHFSYLFKKDKAASAVDLTLDFYRESNQNSVTIK